MGTQHTRFERLRLIAGAALIGCGVFLQSENLTQAATQASHLLGISAQGTPTLGAWVAVGLAASQALQASLFDHQEFLRSLYQISLSFWPVLAVIAGAVLLREGFTEEVEELQKTIPRSRKNRFDLSISSRLVRRLSRAQVRPVEAGRQTGSQSK